nr:MAG TPA: hypothetical protein [Caudoviricetes sp.]
MLLTRRFGTVVTVPTSQYWEVLSVSGGGREP